MRETENDSPKIFRQECKREAKCLFSNVRGLHSNFIPVFLVLF